MHENRNVAQDLKKTILTAVGKLVDSILEDRSKNSEYIAGAMRVLEELEHLCDETVEGSGAFGDLKGPPHS